ncbi:MAG: RluA family pseudouridine synthase [Elusimicrobia bacterium]|nr:RluA family pseudouridine synthase [Elusimicrobiota bacterium]
MEQARLRIVYEDGRILAVDKPAGLAVIPGRGLAEEPLSLQASRAVGGKAFVVHRLDRGASGLVIFAKDAATHRDLSLLFEGGRMRKLYLALVQGRLEGGGVVDRPLRAFGSGRMGLCAKGSGKASLTRYRVLGRAEQASLLEAAPETGRRHQIRVHLHSLGHPILGDPLYGQDRPVGGVGRLMLHAWRLDFELDRASYRLCSAPGADFLGVLGRYGLSL